MRQGPTRGRLATRTEGYVLLSEIVPRVEAEYRVVKTRDGKGIAGVSMGASQSLERNSKGRRSDRYMSSAGYRNPVIGGSTSTLIGHQSESRLLGPVTTWPG